MNGADVAGEPSKSSGWIGRGANETWDAEQAVARMSVNFRECYQAGLWINAEQRGSVRLEMQIDSGGRPSTVTPSGGRGLDRTVVDCLVKVASNASFAPPRNGPTNVIVPLTFGVVR
jgi:hypothetical protein